MVPPAITPPSVDSSLPLPATVLVSSRVSLVRSASASASAAIATSPQPYPAVAHSPNPGNHQLAYGCTLITSIAYSPSPAPGCFGSV